MNCNKTDCVHYKVCEEWKSLCNENYINDSYGDCENYNQTVEISGLPKIHYDRGFIAGYEKGKAERPQGGWIPVSERLPNRNGVYNVTRKLKEGETIYFISDASYFDGQNTWHADTGINHGRPYLTDIIAWQPLPESYKKGGAE